jgi:UPF0716 protein FxsA
MRFALLLFIVMPILEMWLLITIGGFIGAVSTILLVLLTAMVGIGLLREQGFATLWRGREKLKQGQLPAQEMVEGIVLAISGALLLTPGFITDGIGFAGLLPFTRQAMVKGILSRVKIVGNMPHGKTAGTDNGEVIDGEFWDSADELNKPK